MVCNRSLYCWKNGPCATDQARKQIWEDNIKFRKNLRDVNQSDHYWSFQISQNLCLCIEGEDLFHGRQLLRRYKSGSLQKLHDIDCASITHDCNGLKHRNCYVHCPKESIIKNDKGVVTSIPPALLSKRDMGTITKHSLSPFQLPKRSTQEKTEYCHRYKNTLSDSSLKPSTRIKFPSQLNLASGNKNFGTLQKKVMHASCENILKMTDQDQKNDNHMVTNVKGNQTETDEEKKEHGNTEPETKKENILKECKKRPKLVDYNRGYTPVSRTTRKMLYSDKKLPFVTFGCNNNNNDIGSKRTHNVLASTQEIYPNALTAKQHKRDLILKYLQNEKELQRQDVTDTLNRRSINHSSLWSTECIGKEKPPQKSTVLPHVTSQPKKLNEGTHNLDSYPYKTYRKPQIYFY